MAIVGHTTHRPRPEGLLVGLVDEVAEADTPRICVSSERFARADDETAARIVRTWAVTGSTSPPRRAGLDRLPPSSGKSGSAGAATLRRTTTGSASWMSYEPDGDFHEHLWDVADFQALVARWVAVTDPSRVWVIVADERHRRRLHVSFEQLLGLSTG